jgi:hypothetical protein
VQPHVFPSERAKTLPLHKAGTKVKKTLRKIKMTKRKKARAKQVAPID